MWGYATYIQRKNVICASKVITTGDRKPKHWNNEGICILHFCIFGCFSLFQSSLILMSSLHIFLLCLRKHITGVWHWIQLNHVVFVVLYNINYCDVQIKWVFLCCFIVMLNIYQLTAAALTALQYSGQLVFTLLVRSMALSWVRCDFQLGSSMNSFNSWKHVLV